VTEPASNVPLLVAAIQCAPNCRVGNRTITRGSSANHASWVRAQATGIGPMSVAFTKVIDCLRQRVGGNEKSNRRPVVNVRDALSLACERLRPVKLFPACVLALTDGARRAAAPFIVRNELGYSDVLAPILTNMLYSTASNCPRLYALWTRPSDVSNACPALYCFTSPHPSSTMTVPSATTL
jgi:hypothetical protein